MVCGNGAMVIAVGFYNSNMNVQSEYSEQNTSLQQHLTNSIRRAKERIYNNAISNYSQTNQLSISQQNNSSFEMRGRASSYRNSINSGGHRQERNVLASAMRTLQEKIAQLQRENKELRNSSKQTQQINEFARKRQQKQEVQLAKIVSKLREKQQEIKRVSRQNVELKINIANLASKNRELQEQIQKIVNKQLDFPSESNSSEDYRQRLQANMQLIHQQQIKMIQQQQQVKKMQLQNRQKEQALEDLAKKLEHQKKVNMRWIKMHQSLLGDVDQKQNNSLESNSTPQQVSAKAVNPQKKHETHQLIKKNKEMYESLQRSKAKIAELTRQCKQHEQKFTEMKLISLQIVQNVNKVLPHQGSHLKYLTAKIMKMQNHHLQSLRSFSNHSRKSRIMQRNSDSKQRKRSLKMEDLNSSAKKSQSKSHKKRQPIEEQLIRSQKKEKKDEQEQLLQELQREVQALKKRYRNFVMKGEKDKNNEQINRNIQETAKEYNQKKLRYEQLKKQLAAAGRQKRETTRL